VSTREEAADDVQERKERVLHTRVPDSLDRHIKRRARSLGMSVSTVVRNVLLTTFGLVEDIVNDSTDIALAATGHSTGLERRRDAKRAAQPATSVEPIDVVAWQEVVLNRNAVCEQCNALLPKGSRGAIGVSGQPGPHVIICPTCLGAVAQNAPTATKRV
jgi:hypothetical protein